MESAADSIYHRVTLGSEQGISYTVVDSKAGVSMAEMLGYLQEIRRLLPLRVVMGINQRFSLEELEKQDPAALHLGTVMIKLADYYQRHLYMDYCRELEEMLTLLRTGEYSSQQLQHIRNYIRNAMEDRSDIETAELTDLLTRLADQLLASKNKQDGHPQDMISEVIHYIEQHYVSNISISELAAKLSITPNYLSATFHKKTGTTFTKYLTRLRIHRAKELLSSTNLPVKEIALQVGYYSTRHFVKLFVESEGCYPTEFKKQARQ
jgi:two-component system response regulator YesN